MTMGEMHPQEIALACLADGDGDGEADVGAEVAEHLRWCARCRNVAADYRWLQGEVAGTLEAAVEAAPVPRPKWWAVQERLLAARRRELVGGWASVAAGVLLTVCLMLSLSSLLGPAAVAQTPAAVAQTPAAVAQTPPPELAMAPAPGTAPGEPSPFLFLTSTSHSQYSINRSTPTPATSPKEEESGAPPAVSTPAIAPPLEPLPVPTTPE